METFGSEKVRTIAEHLASNPSPENAFGADSFAKFAAKDQDTYLLLMRLNSLRKENQLIFNFVQNELGKSWPKSGGS